jgi:uncharacterized membrane protein
MASYKYGRFTKSSTQTFSDAFFAIIAVLLVIEIKVPEITYPGDLILIHVLVQLLPTIFTWMNTFLFVCVIWMNYNRLMELIEGVDMAIFWLNILLLMFSSLLPFASAMRIEYNISVVALLFYGICLCLPLFIFFILRFYLCRNPDLLRDGVNMALFKKGTLAALINYGPPLVLVGAASSIVSPFISSIIYFLIPLYFIFPKFTQVKN